MKDLKLQPHNIEAEKHMLSCILMDSSIMNETNLTEDDFYLDILRAEREYTRTRLFWDK